MIGTERMVKIAWQVALSCALMWISGQTPIELSGLSVPITLQSMLAILLPLVMVPRNASGGVLLFLILGATGLPVFAGHSGGIQYFQSNSGGYLVGFYIIATLSGRLKPWLTEKGFVPAFLSFVALHLLLTAIGLIWILSLETSVIEFSTHVSPYLPGVVVKSAIGALIFVGIEKLIAHKKR